MPPRSQTPGLSCYSLSWRPFGHIWKSLVELELWPQLEIKYTFTYSVFACYPRESFSILDEGFRRDMGQHLMNVPDNLKMHTSNALWEETYCATNMRPSKESRPRWWAFWSRTLEAVAIGWMPVCQCTLGSSDGYMIGKALTGWRTMRWNRNNSNTFVVAWEVVQWGNSIKELPCVGLRP
jgi:hypothetical protein